MNFIAEKNRIKKALTFVASVVERRNTIPILANVRLCAGNNSVELKTTDIDVEISVSMPAETGGKFETTVPAQMLNSIVGKLSGAAVTFAMDDGRMAIKSGPSRFKLACLPAEDFPDMTAGVMPHKFEIGIAELAELLNKTKLAISTDETRYYLNGIYLHAAETPEGWRLRAVATDGHRLARMDVALPEGGMGMPSIILPRKTVHELGKLLTDTGGKVAVDLSASKIRFTIGDVVLTSKLIDGTFPDYQRVIPQDCDKTLTVPRAGFAAALDRVAILATTGKVRGVKMAVLEGSVMISVENPGAGSASEIVTAEYQGAPIEVGFNAGYLLEIVSALEGDHAQFRLMDGAAPMVIQASEEAAALYVLMPMRV